MIAALTALTVVVSVGRRHEMGPTRRLRNLSAHTRPAAAVISAQQQLPVPLRGLQGLAVGLPMARQGADGQLTPASLTELRNELAAAAAVHDFRRATSIKTMLDVFSPREKAWALSDFCTADADRAADLVLESGFCVLPSLISPSQLQQMREAYEEVEGRCRATFEEQWESGSARADLGKFYSFPMFGEEGNPAFYALLDPPLLMQVPVTAIAIICHHTPATSCRWIPSFSK